MQDFCRKSTGNRIGGSIVGFIVISIGGLVHIVLVDSDKKIKIKTSSDL